jgi:hypothetical protein
MRRFTVSLAVVVVLALGTIATMNRSTIAQEATPDAITVMATHPVIGLWQWDNDPDNPGTDLSYAAFHADGTYVEVGTDGLTLMGVWRASGARTADLTLLSADVDSDPGNTLRAEARQSIEVDETGTAATAEGFFEVRGADGAIVFGGPARAQGTRVEARPVMPLGTPTAGTPVP